MKTLIIALVLMLVYSCSAKYEPASKLVMLPKCVKFAGAIQKKDGSFLPLTRPVFEGEHVGGLICTNDKSVCFFESYCPQ